MRHKTQCVTGWWCSGIGVSSGLVMASTTTEVCEWKENSLLTIKPINDSYHLRSDCPGRGVLHSPAFFDERSLIWNFIMNSSS